MAAINIQTKITDKPICCVLPNSDKPNPFKYLFQFSIIQNSQEQTAETLQISRQKWMLNQYAVFY